MSGFKRLYRGENDIDFRKVWRIGIPLSIVFVILSILSLATRELNLGIDFEGGGVWEVTVVDVSVEDARGVMTGLGEGGAKIQLATSADGTEVLRVQAGVDAVDRSSDITRGLAELAGVDTNQVSVSTVGPSWGDEITRQAQRALIFFFIAITIYISVRLEPKMAVGALVAMVHDLLLSVGVYSLFRIEVTPATLISFLTILGYSLYDTIVVFDRALEISARTVGRTPYRAIMSRTLNQTLMRSVNTTVATILPIVSLLVFGRLLGAETLEEFAVALLVGLTSGAYSSLFVAAPIVSWLKEREDKFAFTGDGSLTLATAGEGRRRGARPGPAGSAPLAAPRSGPAAIPPRPRKKRR